MKNTKALFEFKNNFYNEIKLIRSKIKNNKFLAVIFGDDNLIRTFNFYESENYSDKDQVMIFKADECVYNPVAKYVINSWITYRNDTELDRVDIIQK